MGKQGTLIDTDPAPPFTFKEYVDQLNRFAKKHPEVANFKAITSADDEGNYYNEVWYTPTIGAFKDGNLETGEDTITPNCVCIN